MSARIIKLTYPSLIPRPLPRFQCCTQHLKCGSGLETRLLKNLPTMHSSIILYTAVRSVLSRPPPPPTQGPPPDQMQGPSQGTSTNDGGGGGGGPGGMMTGGGGGGPSTDSSNQQGFPVEAIAGGVVGVIVLALMTLAIVVIIVCSCVKFKMW